MLQTKIATMVMVTAITLINMYSPVIAQSYDSASQLVKQIYSTSKPVRMNATQQLVWHYINDRNAIDMALTLLEPPTEQNLSNAGRINALYYLSKTSSEGWTVNLLGRGRLVASTLKHTHKGKPQTSKLITEFSNHINAF